MSKTGDWDEESLMPFGKHQGTPIGELPLHYLKWMAETFSEKDGERERHLCLLADRLYNERKED